MKTDELAGTILCGLQLADMVRDAVREGRIASRQEMVEFLTDSFVKYVREHGTSVQDTCECGAVASAVTEYFFPLDPQRN